MSIDKVSWPPTASQIFVFRSAVPPPVARTLFCLEDQATALTQARWEFRVWRGVVQDETVPGVVGFSMLFD